MKIRHRVPYIPFLLLWLLASASWVGAAENSWEVTIAVRISDTDGKPVEVHVALPPETAHQVVSSVDVVGRGLSSDVVLGAEPMVVFRGRVDGDRRVAVSYRIDRMGRRTRLPEVQPALDPPRAALDALRPATLYPSRSILVREFLETHVAPKLRDGETDVLRAIYSTVREQLPHRIDGKSLPLDVLRRGFGLRIGLERVFTACLRSAGIPARFVEGMDLSSSTRRKRTFWTEVWAEGEWYAVSASRGWLGNMPDAMVAVALDGRRVLRSVGAGIVEYSVLARPLSAAEAAGLGAEPTEAP